MPIISLEELDAFLQHYASEAPFIYPLINGDKAKEADSCTPKLVHNNAHKMHSSNGLGYQATDFINLARDRYKSGELAPPITGRKVQSIYTLFEQLNQDLTGNETGDEVEQQRAKRWNNYWHNAIVDLNNEGKHLTQDALEKVKTDILMAYRQRIILNCEFKPKGLATHEIDEIRAQEFLQQINQHFAHLTPFENYEHIFNKLVQDFEKDLWLDIQALSRYLNIKQQTEYVKKFEEIISRKTVEFIGNFAITKIFTEITKDREFLKQLPMLLEKGETLRKFIVHFPDKKKRDSLLTASIYEIFNGKGLDRENTIQDKQIQLIQSIMQNASV